MGNAKAGLTAETVLRDALHVSLVQAGFLLSMVQLAGMTLGLARGLPPHEAQKLAEWLVKDRPDAD